MSLAPYAMDVRRSRGRRHPEPDHPYRNAFARDRDRVIHARAFRRLEAKTQVFTTRYSDHFRNRLTHTLEVAQIARTVAGALELNTDLAEALALVHDIGHPPFGHAGEQRLDALMREHGGRFDHNLHALRIVEQFEQRYIEFPGLNLTFEVREGIIKHSRDYGVGAGSHLPGEFPELGEYLLDRRPPLEAQLIDLVDEIAYNTADLDDGFEAELLDVNTTLDAVPLFAEVYREVERRHPQARSKLLLMESIRRVLDRLATDLVEHTAAQVRATFAGRSAGVDDIRDYPRRLVAFSPEAARRNAELKQFLFDELYSQPSIDEDRDQSVDALEALFRFYLAHPDKMPDYYAAQARSTLPHRVVCDYIAGMTDHFLLRLHNELV